MKKIKIGLILILIILAAVCAWFIGYHTRKSQDNLPSLESISKMDEAEINEILIGYRNYQLDDVWGEPDEKSSDNTWVWMLDDHTMLQVNSNNKDKVVICSKKSIFQAEILEIYDTYYLVEPIEGSPELASSDMIEVKIEQLDASLEPEVGDVIEIIHSGVIMESYPAKLRDVYNIRVTVESEGQWDLIPMIMVDGILYLDTGYESKMDGRCGMMDGKILTSVRGSEVPVQNDESNFGIGFEYQYGSQEGTIEIFMNGKWWIFATEEVKEKNNFK